MAGKRRASSRGPMEEYGERGVDVAPVAWM
jgi:hypothetical protein